MKPGATALLQLEAMRDQMSIPTMRRASCREKTYLAGRNNEWWKAQDSTGDGPTKLPWS